MKNAKAIESQGFRLTATIRSLRRLGLTEEQIKEKVRMTINYVFLPPGGIAGGSEPFSPPLNLTVEDLYPHAPPRQLSHLTIHKSPRRKKA